MNETIYLYLHNKNALYKHMEPVLCHLLDIFVSCVKPKQA